MQRVTTSQALATAVQASKGSDVIKVQWNSLCEIPLSFSLSPSPMMYLKNSVFQKWNEMHDSIYSVL